ncbi:MAG TPA: hypothetical protein VML35_10085 [Gaiellaceae bacterium]|nr:hypothetical protein [Gaiellaceae bacterium]
MRLADQWRHVHSDLPEDWADAKLTLTLPRSDQRARAAALLASAGPGRMGDDLRVSVGRGGGAVGPDQLGKLLRKLDAERIRGTLTLVSAGERPVPAAVARTGLADAWARALATLPADWSDLYCEVSLASSDHLDRGALLLAPLNPARVPGRSAFRFRVAHSFGYGTSAEMAARCFARLDEDGITGGIEILRVLSDTHNVDTQGPVWRVGGKAV